MAEEQEGSAPEGARAHLMEEVAAQMDAIEGDFGENFSIGRVVTVVEVVTPNGEVNMRVRANMLPWVALGMLEAAARSVRLPGQQGD